MKNGNALDWLLWVACIVQPRIGRVRLRMTFQVKAFHDSVPAGLAVESLFHWNTNLMCSRATVQGMNCIPQFFDVAHAAASTKSPTLQKLFVIPAAIAGVQRTV